LIVVGLVLCLVALCTIVAVDFREGRSPQTRKVPSEIQGKIDQPMAAADPEEFWERVRRQLPDRPKFQPPAWEPTTDADKVVDRFVKLWNAGDPAASHQLGRVPTVPADPVSEGEAERLQTDFFLREAVRVQTICRGEPNDEGGLKATPGLYTLIVKGGVAAPELRVRANGGVDNVQRTVLNPSLVVEVCDGKVFGVRATGPL
jgi:hypothetical protein